MVLLLFFLTACDKFEGDQTVPCWLSIEKIDLTDNPSIEEGVLSQNFTDVWVYVDDQILGAYELPAVIPVLEEGRHKLLITPGVKYNGISGTRGPYQFIEPYVDNDFMFIKDELILIRPELSYYDNTVFRWTEDFEDGFISFEATANSDTALNLVYHDPPDTLLQYISGAGYVDANRQVLECATNVSEGNGFELPGGSSPVFLEIDYNTNLPFVIGLYVTRLAEVIQNPIVVINPTNGEWKKMYVNMTSVVSDYGNALHFNVFLRMEYESGMESPVLQIDNIRLLHKPMNR